jgi:hypothetical protein
MEAIEIYTSSSEEDKTFTSKEMKNDIEYEQYTRKWQVNEQTGMKELRIDRRITFSYKEEENVYYKITYEYTGPGGTQIPVETLKCNENGEPIE